MNTTKKQVGIWIRVSTEDQAKGESPENHEQRARSYAQIKDWEVIEVYHLEAVSGKAVLHHPEAQRMLKDIGTGKITGLIFSKIARLARNTRELLQIADIFKQYNADLISLQESIDTSSPAGRFFYTLISAMAQWEREEIADRVSASIPIRAKLGKPLGGQAPYGYEWKDKKLITSETEAPIRKLIYDLFLEHKRKNTVAEILNKRGYRTRNGSKFSYTTVVRLLEDPIAKGMRRTNYTASTGDSKHWKLKKTDDWVFQDVPAIIEEEVWDKVNGVLTEQAKNNKQPLNKKTHLFTGYVICNCGTKMYLLSNNPKYTCQKCKNKIPEETLEEIFYTKLQEYTIYKENIERYILDNNNTMSEKEVLLKTSQKEAQKIQSKLDNLIELHLNKQMPTEGFKHHYSPLFEQLQQILAQIPQIEGEILALKQNEENSKYIFSEAENLFSKWNTLTKDQKRDIVESITESIIIDSEEVTINVKYLMPPSSLNPTNGHHNFIVSLPICNVQLKAQKPNRKPYPKEFITYGDHLRKKRLDLNLYQSAVAKIINVTINTITNWELNRNIPDLYQIPKIIEFLGYIPTLNENSIKQYRIQKGISQKEMARILEIDTTTLSRIERSSDRISGKVKMKLSSLILDS